MGSGSGSTRKSLVEKRRWRNPQEHLRLDTSIESIEDRIRDYLQEYTLGYEEEDADLGGFHDSFEKVIMYKNTRLISAHGPEPAPAQGQGEKAAVKAAIPGTAIFELEIKPPLCSVVGNIHGGAAALIFDMCTSVAMGTVAKKGLWDTTGVSRVLSVSYYRPVPVREHVVVICRVMQVGKTMATILGEMRRKKDGVLLCSAEHHKAGAEVDKRINKI